jgi:hypothetical protein
MILVSIVLIFNVIGFYFYTVHLMGRSSLIYMLFYVLNMFLKHSIGFTLITTKIII